MKILKVLFALGVVFPAIAQNNEWCGMDMVIQRMVEQNPNYRQMLHEKMSYAAEHPVESSSRALITIPVVVHVIHANGVGNISEAQVLNGLEILNRDYNRMNADTVNTRETANAPFKHIADGLNIEFKLAKRDPNGNCTNGIVRVNAPELSNNADDGCKYSFNGGSDQWPPERYFNIWVVNTIANNGGGGTILGYAYYPYGGAGSEYGILIRNDVFGEIGTAQGNNDRTLTHEMGHALGLAHIFDAGFGGGTGCHSTDCTQAGDYVCDTPPQTEANWSCSQTWNSCNLVPVNDAFGFDVYDQIENYMSYNSCQNMFSAGQVSRMETNLMTIDFLDSLHSSYTAFLTGVNDPAVLCEADFDAYDRLICAGTEVSFIDFSHSNPTSWSWSVSPGTEGTEFDFVGGTTSSSQSPTIRFNSSGLYSVSLSVSDGLATVSETKSDFIVVLAESASMPFLEGFENLTSLNGSLEWQVYNPGNNAKFEVFSGAGHSGVKSARLNNFGQASGNSDELISSPVDLSVLDPNTDQVTLSFRYAYRKRNSANDEWLKVFITGNCGETWAQRKTIHGIFLSPDVATTPWTPSSQSDWTTVHVTNITSGYFVENFRYKFEFESDGGNNFYLDDINIYSGSPSDDLVLENPELDEAIFDLKVYPNPVDNEITVDFTLIESKSISLELLDLSGRVVQQTFVNASSGHNVVVMDVSTLASGNYLMKMNTGAFAEVRKVMVK